MGVPCHNSNGNPILEKNVFGYFSCFIKQIKQQFGFSLFYIYSVLYSDGKNFAIHQACIFMNNILMLDNLVGNL